jgi:polyhydroxyalkanoate synthesis regulator phasin
LYASSSANERSIVGVAVMIALIETMVEKGALSPDEAKRILTKAKTAIQSSGHSIAVTDASALIDKQMLPRFSGP